MRSFLPWLHFSMTWGVGHMCFLCFSRGISYEEGLFIVDDAVKEVVVSHFDDLGVDFNVREEEQ